MMRSYAAWTVTKIVERRVSKEACTCVRVQSTKSGCEVDLTWNKLDHSTAVVIKPRLALPASPKWEDLGQ